MPEQISDWKVLIIDDDTDNLGVACEFLEFLGATVRTARDGEEGLESLKDFEPTVILLDLSMPVMDGWQMIKKLKEDEKQAAIPVIALTAHAMSHDRERVIEAGFDGHIIKPFLLSSLVDDIKRYLTNKGQADAKKKS
ncbi:MAG: response regulator [Anaerolineae bacterium]|nr:response regulator [Anaerolineae bacterium]